MEIIPVIDLMKGQAVLARRGQRHLYKPLSTSLCRSSDPHDAIDALLNLHPFATIYLADLDALMGLGSQRSLIGSLQARHPGLEFWVDAGVPLGDEPWLPVIGTESLHVPAWENLSATQGQWILSLDSFGDQRQGLREIWEQTHLWPQRIIVMNLQRVGCCDGPDWDRLASIRRLAGERELIAAGGVRDLTDLRGLESMGIHAALVASALHSGQLRSEHLLSFGSG